MLFRRPGTRVGQELTEPGTVVGDTRVQGCQHGIRADGMRDLVFRDAGADGELGQGWLPAESGHENPAGSRDAVQHFDDMRRQADRASGVGNRPRDRLADPKRGVRRELEAATILEFADGAQQAEIAFLRRSRNESDECRYRLAIETTRRRLASINCRLRRRTSASRSAMRAPAGPESGAAA